MSTPTGPPSWPPRLTLSTPLVSITPFLLPRSRLAGNFLNVHHALGSSPFRSVATSRQPLALSRAIAGHSISAGAAAGVLANYFNTDKVAFTIGTEYPGLPPRSYKSFQASHVAQSCVWSTPRGAPQPSMHSTSTLQHSCRGSSRADIGIVLQAVHALPAVLQEAVDDVGISRVYAGVHYRNSVDDGASLGAQVRVGHAVQAVHAAPQQSTRMGRGAMQFCLPQEFLSGLRQC